MSESELGLIARIARIARVRPGVSLGIGDDAAVLDGAPPVVVAQDLLVDDVHFRRTTSSFTEIGHKAVAVNLSDLAAMGATPVAVFIGLGLPTTDPLSDADIDALYSGMEALAAQHGVTIAGGDITTAPSLLLAVTAVGQMRDGLAPARRSGAQPGDVVCVTGSLGGAAAGLVILDRPELATECVDADALRSASRTPTPRVDEGRALAGAGVTAMMDCSDGLGLDASRMAEASGVGMVLDVDRVPVARGVAHVASRLGTFPDMLATTGGDDYELLVTTPSDRVAHLQGILSIPLTVVGRVTDGSGLTLLRNGEVVDAPTLGWEHHFTS